MLWREKTKVNSDLRTRRKASKLTQDELALLVGVTRQTIIAIEKGNYTPSVLLALKLSKALKVNVEEIFGL
jgi:putative transcriptional regulator